MQIVIIGRWSFIVLSAGAIARARVASAGGNAFCFTHRERECRLSSCAPLKVYSESVFVHRTGRNRPITSSGFTFIY
jgi:hypothetical protein